MIIFIVLDPQLPRLLGDVLVDALAERMTVERRLVQPFHLPLELHAEYFSGAAIHWILPRWM